jgi:dolichol-phosphate mannosyltransferase
VDLTVILPTYNERECLAALHERFEAAVRPYSAEILVVDDSSPDGTGVFVRWLSGNGGPWKLLSRDGERGLATAVVDGFRQARGEVLAVMDADGSHPPETLPKLIAPIAEERAEFVLASRFVPGGSDEGLTPARRVVSWAAAFGARGLTAVHDPMSGFFALRRSVLERSSLAPVGYKIGLEVLVKCHPSPVLEVPFTFRRRVAGISKLGSRQIVGYAHHLERLYRWRYAGAGRASSTR